MTCIIGFTDKEHGVSWIGGDSLGSNGYTKSSELSAKVFRNELFKNVLIGGTTTFRHLDLLRYSEDLFDEVDFYKKSEIDHTGIPGAEVSADGERGTSSLLWRGIAKVPLSMLGLQPMKRHDSSKREAGTRCSRWP